MGKLLMAVIFGLAIWNLISSLMANVIGPALGSILGPDANLPASFTRNYDYPDLLLAVIQFCIAAIVAIAINWFMQRGSRNSMTEAVPVSSTNLSSTQPSILPPLPVPASVAGEPVMQSKTEELKPIASRVAPVAVPIANPRPTASATATPDAPPSVTPGWTKVQTSAPAPVQTRVRTERVLESEFVSQPNSTLPTNVEPVRSAEAGEPPKPITVGPIAVASALKPTVKPPLQDAMPRSAPATVPAATVTPPVAPPSPSAPEKAKTGVTTSPATGAKVAPSKPKKEKQIYYNIVGEPVEMDD
jgi:large-conductance mechanosensitive channel